MIAPLVPYGLRGAIWYQGESNVGRAAEYQVLLPTLIADWRARFHERFSVLRRSAHELSRASQHAPGKRVGRAPRRAGEGRGGRSELGARRHHRHRRRGRHPPDEQARRRRTARPRRARQDLPKARRVFGPRPRIGEGGRREASRGVLARRRRTQARGRREEAPGFRDRRHRQEVRLGGREASTARASCSRAPTTRQPRHVRYAWSDNPAVNLVNAEKLPAVPFEADAAPSASGRQQ